MSLLARFQMVRSQTTPVVANLMQKDWYTFFWNLYLAATEGLPQPAEVVPLPASPGVYVAIIRGQLHVGGGNVSAVEFSRDGTNWFDTGLVEGFVEMDKADSVRVTYSVAPALTFFPM